MRRTNIQDSFFIAPDKHYTTSFVIADDLVRYFTRLFKKRVSLSHIFIQKFSQVNRLYVFTYLPKYIYLKRKFVLARLQRVFRRRKVRKAYSLLLKNTLHKAEKKTKIFKQKHLHFFGLFFNLLQKRALRDCSIYLKKLTHVHFILLDNRNVTAEVFGKYIIRRLEKGYLPGEIIRNYVFKFSRRSTRKSVNPLFGHSLSGIVLKANGRFTRQQRASHSIFNYGSVPLGTHSAKIEYCFLTVPLRYGACGINLYINKGFYKK